MDHQTQPHQSESSQDISLTVSVFNPFINKLKFLIPPNVKNKYWDVN